MKQILEWLKYFNFFRKKEPYKRKTKFKIGDSVMLIGEDDQKAYGDGVVVKVFVNMLDEEFYTIAFKDGSKACCEEKIVVPSYYQQDFMEKIRDRIK